MADKNMVVVIPVYTVQMTYLERISLQQCANVLAGYDISFISFDDRILTFYDSLMSSFNGNLIISLIKVDKFFFENIEGYNRLMLSSFFYRHFIKYKFLLIYQLDCFVFSSDFSFWLNSSYDYVGAPWSDSTKSQKLYESLVFSTNSVLKFMKESIDFNKGRKVYVGNGGFSLRRVRTFFRLSKYLKFIEPNIVSSKINEDMVWSVIVPKYFFFFKTPTVELASKFSLETEPARGFRMNGEELPLGCHGWSKHDFSFWKPHIDKFGYSLP